MTFANLTQLAPAAIKDAMNTLNAVVQAAKTPDDLVDSPALKTAGDALDAWSLTHCGAKFSQ